MQNRHFIRILCLPTLIFQTAIYAISQGFGISTMPGLFFELAFVTIISLATEFGRRLVENPDGDRSHSFGCLLLLGPEGG